MDMRIKLNIKNRNIYCEKLADLTLWFNIVNHTHYEKKCTTKLPIY